MSQEARDNEAIIDFLDQLSGPPLRRFTIHRGVSWPHLTRWIADHSDETLEIIGKGDWARRLLHRLARERPNVEVTEGQFGEWEAIVDRQLHTLPVVASHLTRGRSTPAS